MNSILALAIVLLILMGLIGGSQGILSFFTLGGNGFILVFMVVLMGFGLDPIIMAILFGLVILADIIFLTTNNQRITGAVFLSTILVMAITVTIIIIALLISKTAGFALEDSESLEGFSPLIGLSFLKIQIATVLLSTLGAIAEAAIAVATGIDEIRDQDNLAGVNLIADKVTGTTLNTLFFGVFGGFCSLFIWFIQLNYRFSQIINNKIFVGEIILVLISMIAVILAVNITKWLLLKVAKIK